MCHVFLCRLHRAPTEQARPPRTPRRHSHTARHALVLTRPFSRSHAATHTGPHESCAHTCAAARRALLSLNMCTLQSTHGYTATSYQYSCTAVCTRGGECREHLHISRGAHVLDNAPTRVLYSTVYCTVSTCASKSRKIA